MRKLRSILPKRTIACLWLLLPQILGVERSRVQVPQRDSALLRHPVPA